MMVNYCKTCGHLQSEHDRQDCCSRCYCKSLGYSAQKPASPLQFIGDLLASLFMPRRTTFRCRDCGVELPDSENYCCQDVNGNMRSGMCKSCMFAFAAGPQGRKAAI